jgi:hypothetical protein
MKLRFFLSSVVSAALCLALGVPGSLAQTVLVHGKNVQTSVRLPDASSYKTHAFIVTTEGDSIQKLPVQHDEKGAFVDWNGVTSFGVPAPNGVYSVSASPQSSPLQLAFDNTVLTGVSVKSDTVAFTLTKPSRMVVRAGIEDGLLLDEIVSYRSFAAGVHTFHWQKPAILNKYPPPSEKLAFAVMAMPLPSQSFVVTGPSSPTYNDFYTAYFPEKIKTLQSQPDTQTELPIKPTLLLKFVDDQGKPLDPTRLTGKCVVQLSFDGPTAVLGAVSEIAFFIDYVFASEAEQGILPFSWVMDTSTLAEGEHVLSANINLTGSTVLTTHAVVRIARQ